MSDVPSGGTGLELWILGTIEARRDGETISLPEGRRRALLAILALRGNEVVPADELIEELWEGSPPATARNTLQVYVSQLRRVLGREAILTRLPGYVLSVTATDARLFERLATDGRTALRLGEAGRASSLLRQALALWRGDVLEEFRLSRFAEAERLRLDEARLVALEDRIEADLASGRGAELVPELRGLVAEQPLRERLRAQLVLALYRADRQAEALTEYRRAREELLEQLGLEPGPALRRLERMILRQDEALEPQAGRLALPPLPVPPTPLLGRERELREAVALLRSNEVRLVTLTGPGGIGKTRLALEVARALEDDFADGVVFVDLAPVSQAALVSPTIVKALGRASEGGDRPIEPLESFLAARSLLLVLDNFEQVLAAAPLVAVLLGSAPRLRMLATSRSTLRLAGEQEFPVPPLPLPDPASGYDEVERSPAVQLFVRRAGEVRRGFALTRPNAEVVARICGRLEGIPLALELAASRAKLLEPEEILEGLGRRLELLRGGPRDAPPRQRTLRATLDWSYRLLDDEGRRLLARLGVFVGGWTVDAAGRVCGIPEGALVDRIGLLVDESLVRRLGPDPPPRFGMLDTVREYALERLEASGEAVGLARRHLEYLLELAETAESRLEGTEQRHWLDVLEQEHDNLRAAFKFALDSGDRERTLRLACALGRFWQLHGHLVEGRLALAAALERPDHVSPAVLAKAFNGAGVLAGEQGDFGNADALFEQGLEAARAAGDRHMTASLLSNLGTLALFREDLDRASAHYAEAVRLWEETDNRQMLAAVLENLGSTTLRRGRLPEAVELFEESERLARETGHDHNLASALRALGRALLLLGEPKQARERLEESLAITRELRERHGIAECLEALAGVATADGDASRAAALFGAAVRIRDDIGAPRAPDQQAWFERYFGAARERAGASAFDAELERGRALPDEAAFALALGERG